MLKDYEVFFKCELTSDYNITIQGEQKGRWLQPFKDKELVVTISAKKPSKTKKQLGLWFGLIIPQCQQFHKYTQGEDLPKFLMHIWICTNILGISLESVSIGGKEYIDPERFRLSKATIGEFSEIVEKTIEFYSERGFKIQLPENAENDFETFSDLILTL